MENNQFRQILDRNEKKKIAITTIDRWYKNPSQIGTEEEWFRLQNKFKAYKYNIYHLNKM